MTIDVTLDHRCSFCGKKQGEVKQFIAGPGVYICDECVALCGLILENRPAPDFPSLDDQSDDDLVADMARIAASREQVEEAVFDRVQRLRRRGVTWARIGGALGISRQSAWERFSTDQD